jgi:hypothetical protein
MCHRCVALVSDPNGRSSAEKSGEPSLCKALAARSPVGKVNHQIAAALLRKRMCDKFGGFSGRIVAELPPPVVLHDPVVEAVVRHDVNGGDRHEHLLSIGREGVSNASPTSSIAALTIINFSAQVPPGRQN